MLLHVRFNSALERPNYGCGREALAAPIPCGCRRGLALESDIYTQTHLFWTTTRSEILSAGQKFLFQPHQYVSHRPQPKVYNRTICL